MLSKSNSTVWTCPMFFVDTKLLQACRKHCNHLCTWQISLLSFVAVFSNNPVSAEKSWTFRKLLVSLELRGALPSARWFRWPVWQLPVCVPLRGVALPPCSLVSLARFWRSAHNSCCPAAASSRARISWALFSRLKGSASNPFSDDIIASNTSLSFDIFFWTQNLVKWRSFTKFPRHVCAFTQKSRQNCRIPMTSGWRPWQTDRETARELTAPRNGAPHQSLPDQHAVDDVRVTPVTNRQRNSARAHRSAQRCSAPVPPRPACSRWRQGDARDKQTEKLRESSPLRATVLRTSPSPTSMQ